MHHRARTSSFAWRSNTPSSNDSGSFVLPMSTPPPQCRLSASALRPFFQNYLSLWRFLGFQLITILLNAVFAHWWWPAKSVEARAVPKAHRRAWDSPVFSGRGWLSTSILSTNVSPHWSPILPWVKSEQFLQREVVAQVRRIW